MFTRVRAKKRCSNAKANCCLFCAVTNQTTCQIDVVHIACEVGCAFASDHAIISYAVCVDLEQHSMFSRLSLSGQFVWVLICAHNNADMHTVHSSEHITTSKGW